MIMFNFFIALFALFVSPHIFLYYRFKTLEYPLVLTYSFIISFSSIWILTLLTFYLNIPNIVIYILAVAIVVSSLVYMLMKHQDSHRNENNYLPWILSILLLLPIYQSTSIGFSDWDAVVSWNRWALELYNNEYHPIHASYPLLLPALYSMIYKIQGTNEIWWTAKLALFSLPLINLVLSLVLYKTYKNITFLWITVFLYPYYYLERLVNGEADMPVMLMGMLTLMILYVAEINKKNEKYEYYVYASLLLAGLSSITKQSGLAFLLFDIIYILLNLKSFHNYRRLWVVVFIAVLYFLSFLPMYYLHAFTGATGNLALLTSLSAYSFAHKHLLWEKFFSYPPDIPLLEPFSQLISHTPIMPYLMFFGLFLFIFRTTRKYNSIAVLSVIFLIFGFLAWGKYASYHPRNSYWVKVFLIMFVSINLNYLITWVKEKKISSFLLLAIIILSGLWFLNLNDQVTQQKQKQFQAKLGWPEQAKKIQNIITHSPSCVKVYTNNYMMKYNYYTKEIQDHFTYSEITKDFLKKSIENNCTEGSYLAFRGSTKSYTIWKHTIRYLILNHSITPYHESGYLYYSKPFNRLKQDLLNDHTMLVTKEILNFDDDIRFYIDNMNERNNTIRLNGWAFPKNTNDEVKEKYIVLKNDKNTYTVVCNVTLRADVAAQFKNKNLLKSGFKTYIYTKDLVPGVYNIYILLVEKNGMQHFSKTDKVITIKGQQ